MEVIQSRRCQEYGEVVSAKRFSLLRAAFLRRSAVPLVLAVCILWNSVVARVGADIQHRAIVASALSPDTIPYADLFRFVDRTRPPQSAASGRRTVSISTEISLCCCPSISTNTAL